MFSLDFWYFYLSFSYEIKLYMKSGWQAGMSLKTIILRIQLHIPALFSDQAEGLDGRHDKLWGELWELLLSG